MSCDSVDAEGLAILIQLKSLRILDVWGVSVDNAAAAALCQFRNLNELRLDQNKVQGDGMKQIREALPNCKVSGR
jgi:hypothetical protein